MINFLPPTEDQEQTANSASGFDDPPKKQQNKLNSLLQSLPKDQKQAVATDPDLAMPVAKSVLLTPSIEPRKPNPSFDKKTDLANKIDQTEPEYDVNLLPQSISFKSNNKILSMALVWGGLSLLLILLVFGTLSLYGQKITEESLALEVEIEQLDTNISQYNDLIGLAADWQIKLATVDDLLRTHIYWTKFFAILEKVTLPSVYYKGFTASIINPDINLTSYASSFTEVARQLVGYQNFMDVFEQVNAIQ